MKRVLMRAFWGINDKSHRILARKYRVEKNITDLLKNKFNYPFITYVFGKDNLKYLNDLGVKDCILIHDEPFKYDLIKEQYRHKLEALRYAMEEDGYTHMVHLDWDCLPKRKVDENFWNLLDKKESFQANLIQYRRPKARWRKIDQRKIPNGGFVYLRDKNIPAKLISIWETMKGPSAEPPMAKYIDQLFDNQWIGIEKYWDLFEPLVCQTHKQSVYTIDYFKQKTLYFWHRQGVTN